MITVRADLTGCAGVSVSRPHHKRVYLDGGLIDAAVRKALGLSHRYAG